MGLSLGIGLGLTAVRGGNAWSPGRLAGLAPTLLPALSRAQGKLWQDSGKTSAATADGHPVRVGTCPFTGLDYTAPSDAARPVLKTDGANRWWLLFDGVDDVLQSPALTWSGTVGSLAACFAQAASATLVPVVNTRAFTGNGDYWQVVGMEYARNFRVARLDAAAVVPDVTTKQTAAWVSGATTYKTYRNGSVLISNTPNWEAPTQIEVARTDTTTFGGLKVGGVIPAQAEWDAATLAQVLTYLNGLLP